MSEELQTKVLGIISAILHVGNIQFAEENNVAEVENPEGKSLVEERRRGKADRLPTD